jgi:hypothetical protein
MKFIVTNLHGQPMKLGGFKFAVEAIAVPASLESASRFDSTVAAFKEAKRMMNLGGFRVTPLQPLDQQ